jgi:transposase
MLCGLKRILAEENLIQGDITPRLLYGADEDGEGLNITWGYNKEHRKDLKTVLYDLLLSGVDGKK